MTIQPRIDHFEPLLALPVCTLLPRYYRPEVMMQTRRGYWLFSRLAAIV